MIEVLDRPEDVGLSASRLARIHEHLERAYVKAGKLAGTVVMVTRRGQVAYLDVCGHRDIENGAPMRDDTLFRIYSMTKPVTSVALMSLYEEGFFQLDDPVSRFIPAWRDLRVWDDGNTTSYRTRFPEREMTIRDLLTHTSGLTYGFMDDSSLATLYQKRGVERSAGGTTAAMVDKLSELPLLFSPGSSWGYSVATDVCGHLVEVIAAMALDRFFSERIFEPLGMPDTAFHVPAGKLDRLSANYAATKRRPLLLFDAPTSSTYATPPEFLSGGGGLVSTVADYHRFTQMLLNKGQLDGVRILGRRTVEYMTMNHLPTGGDLASMGQRVFSETSYDGVGFGLGFSVVIDPARSQVVSSLGEYAWGGAASTGFWVDPVEEMTVILMAQLMPSSTYPIRRELRSLVYQALVD